MSVVTGGYGGSMEAVSRGAASVEAHVIGVTAPLIFASRSTANRFVAEEIEAATLTQRITTMTDMSAAAIALHGSIGTLTELMAAWNTAFVTRFSAANARPVVAVGDLWRDIVSSLGATLSTDATLVTVVDDVEAAVLAVRAQLGV